MNYKKGLKPLNLALIQGLRDWKDRSTKGWKFMSEIFRDAPNWGSQPENFPKYMKELVICGIVQSRDVMIGKKGRPPVSKKSWRLRQTVKAANLIKLALGMHYNNVYYDKQLSSKKDILLALKNKNGPVYKYGPPFLKAGNIPNNMPDGSLIKDRGPYGFEYDRIMLKGVLQDNKNKDQTDIINAMVRLKANENSIKSAIRRQSEKDQKFINEQIEKRFKQLMKNEIWRQAE